PHYLTPQSVMLANSFPVVKGKYQIHDVHLSVYGPFGFEPEFVYQTMAPNEVGKMIESPYLRLRPDASKQAFFVWINGSNGTYYQYILFLKISNEWVWASRLYKGGESIKGRKPLKQWFGQGFPKNYGEAEWLKD